MPKSSNQIHSFLSACKYRTKTDWEMIAAFCKEKTELPRSYELDPEHGISCSDFTRWYDSGFGAGDIAETESGEVILLGLTNFTTSRIVAELSDNQILTIPAETPQNALKPAPEASITLFKSLLLKENLQFNWETLSLSPKYIPSVNERVIFRGNNETGLGVVRSLNLETGFVSLYCYYLYESKRCSYSMNETEVCNLYDYDFETMENGNKTTRTLNAISCQRKLNRELSRYGKTWNQSRHRIEPLEPSVKKGESYWYFNDRFVLTQATENETPTSRSRLLAGNYFKTAKRGNEVKAMLDDLISSVFAAFEGNG